MTGLNDHHIARKIGELHQKYDPDYILEKKPNVIILNSLTNPEEELVADYWEGEAALFEHPEFKQNYVPIAKVWKRLRNQGGVAYILLFVRK